MSMLHRAALVVLCVVLGACGSVSRLERNRDHDFRAYDTIVIAAFDNEPAVAIAPGKRSEYDRQVAVAAARFAHYLERELRAYRMHVDVVHGEPRPGALVIEGTITRYANGNAALRLLIGFGAGSSYFDASVRFRDADSGELLGTVIVDKNSWPIASGVAAFQTGDAEVLGAAKRVAEEIAFQRGVIRKRGAHRLGHRPVGCGRGGPNCGKYER